ncbi:MAG: TonB-dependent receptor plug domain-containing protein [Gammaproteobacteria bacterium]|nr:TonB-dependent receptor plug domain-containing protein [Chromatiales bacterium]MYE47949.1 TonB-dependent receptor plug domain-containing protein [Gammaproteobacteria bacterium]
MHLRRFKTGADKWAVNAILIFHTLLTVVGSAQDAELDESWEADAGDGAFDIEEILVTGQKRTETLLESDVAVTVMTEEFIDEARIRDLRRIDDLVPNVQFNETAQLSSVFVTIRGIESNPYIVNRAALYIDGIPFRELSNAVLSQIESIEVLRGPQSTLYGANSEAGLLIINSRQPGRERESDIRLTGSTYNGNHGYILDAFLGGPLADDTLSASLALRALKEDSYITNPASLTGEPGEIRDLFLQARVAWQPADSLTIKGTAYILDTDAPGLFDQEYAPVDRRHYDGIYRDYFNGGREVGKFEFLNDAPKHTMEKDLVAGLSATWDLEYGSLDMAYSFTKLDKDSSGLDLDLTAGNWFQFPNPFYMPGNPLFGPPFFEIPGLAGREIENEKFWSGELRFTSPDSDQFDYIVGMSWYKEDKRTVLTTSAFNPLLNDYNPYVLTPPQFARGEDFALFGSATFSLGIDGLSATVGLRHDWADRETIQQEGPPLNIGLVQLNFYNIQLDDSYTEILPRLVLSYDASESVNAYASASKGYIPGGFNLTLAEDASISEDLTIYDKESVWSYEVGLKTRLPDGRGYLNLAAFYIQSDNWQEVRVLTDDMGRVTSSAFIGANADIESYGFEIETVYQANDNLKLVASYGYTNATYKDFLFRAGAQGEAVQEFDLDGEPVKLVPSFDANFSALYEFGGGYFLRGELSVTGETPLEERSRVLRDRVNVVNLQAGYEGDKYRLQLFVENLTDERYPSGLGFEHFLFGADGTYYVPLDAPRIVGVEFGVGW